MEVGGLQRLREQVPENPFSTSWLPPDSFLGKRPTEPSGWPWAPQQATEAHSRPQRPTAGKGQARPGQARPGQAKARPRPGQGQARPGQGQGQGQARPGFRSTLGAGDAGPNFFFENFKITS